MKKIVLIGNGMAGVRTLEELFKITEEKFDITVFGSEPYGNYNRIMLSPVLAGEKTIDEIMINDLDWYKDNDITLHTDSTITSINRSSKTVIDDKGNSYGYDKLLIATGSNPFILPIEGHDLDGVIGFRDIADVDQMIDAAKNHKNAIVIGGGLLGLEAANGLMKQGMNVTVVHLLADLMEMQLDSTASQMLLTSLRERGMSFKLEAQTQKLIADDSGRVKQIEFSDESAMDADLVVMAVGIRPNFILAQESGIHCERGIVVDDTMLTFDPSIYAVGECIQHRGLCYGLVAPLFEQAKVCANHLAEYGIGMYEGSVTSTKLKVTGIDLFSAGNFKGTENSEDLVFQDVARGVYKKIVIENDIIIGSVMYGDTIDGSWYFQLMKDENNIADMRDRLLFGQAHVGDSGHGPLDMVAAMDDSAEICGCNGVCKGDIVSAINEKNLFTLEDVRAHTKASSSCGSCTGLVEQLIATTLGGEYSESPKKKPICGCTENTKQEVHDFIFKNDFDTVFEVFAKMDWENADGCHVCRPEVNYYLLAANPDYEDDAQSRFINERSHGNIQKDGTYSVVPRMWGGVTTPLELRTIADVVDKFNIPTMKVTGGQRIDLFGVTKEDLPKVWKDLGAGGLVSGHAYGKSLRTVKTCAGDTWCRFGTKDSMGMGVTLEKMTWGSWMPHKFKLAVSGCPRNCAEATIKDFGLVAVQSGWELHVGGNGGIKVRVTDLLTRVESDEEAIEYVGAYCQLYREDALYLERTAPWIDRVGLSFVTEQLVDDEANRKALHARFLVSQLKTQNDPWKERAEGAQSHQFEVITQ
ncbi:MAG TPA: nitrite reductase large subunit [Gammaproteobacteria bacterium]|jgi:nitrite reductase (NADH) large subunit|nr:nitrite reductase large subunit [Gammaproteobacteria bacterium]HBA98669.1 nitrite reductase large subunit [Gammaproteobacteria bacterium]HBN58454.1 nitrite reductase large subunit [Gammaproteobacteria bacterium]HBQ23934.1 nitrite reductase large subunit [Gammaproteobacteria bacterium]HCJ98384.1 nitrite reductase large subunit [Gammaproteobacteria bacterium]